MSDITDTKSEHAAYAGLTVDIAEDSLNRVTKLLSGIKDGVYKAVGSALTRAAAAGKTTAKQAVTKEYTIGQSEFLKRTNNINHFIRDSGGGVSVVFGFRGYVIPLMQFNTHIGNDGRVVTHVKKSRTSQVLEHAFSARLGSHQGIYERIGVKRFPVKELYGPATPQMMYSNEKVMDEIEAKMAQTYEKRIEHEILRVLNGWGG